MGGSFPSKVMAWALTCWHRITETNYPGVALGSCCLSSWNLPNRFRHLEHRIKRSFYIDEAEARAEAAAEVAVKGEGTCRRTPNPKSVFAETDVTFSYLLPNVWIFDSAS